MMDTGGRHALERAGSGPCAVRCIDSNPTSSFIHRGKQNSVLQRNNVLDERILFAGTYIPNHVGALLGTVRYPKLAAMFQIRGSEEKQA
jgi:hypothetical protein